MMFGPRLTTVFASRWKALLWSASILFSAYCFVPAQGDGDSAASDNQAAVKMVEGLMPGSRPSAEPSRSPWAPDKPASPATH